MGRRRALPKNRARASRHPRWNAARIVSAHGYVKVRVGVGHPLADPNGYAYEHTLVWVAAGRRRPRRGERLHHRNHDKTDNRLANLRLMLAGAHAAEHARTRRRDANGRFR